MEFKNETRKSAPRSLKGQAAMEYLMTYGWAILVIVIVLAVLLFYLPQFLRAPESCVFSSAGFTCSDQRPTIFVASDNTVHLAINVFNGQGKAITVSKVMCTTGSTVNTNSTEGESTGTPEFPDDIAAGQVVPYANVPCEDASGNAVSFAPGSDFRGNFIIWYRYTDDIAPPGVSRQANAIVSGPVLGQ